MGFRLRFLCPPPWSVVFLGLTGRVWGDAVGGGDTMGGGGGGCRLRATRAHIREPKPFPPRPYLNPTP